MNEHGEKGEAGRLRREQGKIPNHADTNSLGETGRGRRSAGCEPQRGNGENFKEDDTEQRAELIGKILSQLRELREAHLAYVNAHSDRLKARLAEDDEHRSQIVEGMDALEQEILLIQANQENEEG